MKGIGGLSQKLVSKNKTDFYSHVYLSVAIITVERIFSTINIVMYQMRDE